MERNTETMKKVATSRRKAVFNVPNYNSPSSRLTIDPRQRKEVNFAI